MADNGKMQDQNVAKIKDSGDVALMIDGLYNWLTYDLKKLKEEIMADTQKKVDGVLRELKYSYQQNQAVYEEVNQLIEEKVVSQLGGASAPVAAVKSNYVSNDDAALAEMVNNAVARAMRTLDYDKLAEAVVAKMDGVHSASIADQIDVNELADKIADRVEPFDYDTMATLVVEKLDETGSAPYEVVIDRDGVREIADRVAANLDSEVVADRVTEKIVLTKDTQQDQIIDIVMDEESVQAIADAVAEKLSCVCVQAAEEPAVEETVEEPVAEEVVEEGVEEVVEEPVVEETVEEPVVEEVVQEVAPAAVQEVSEDGNELVDPETGLVIRLKRSFVAKMKQSDDDVKIAYSRIKNALRAYKKVNSNVSWHGDRFNFGRETIARMNICGKTLGLYLALDPANEEEFKKSVYHQKDVSGQKAYEGTPFMVKVRSEGAVKKALRLVAALAEKYGCEVDEEFVEENYVEEFAFQTTKELLDEGLIKQTKEKKVALNF